MRKRILLTLAYASAALTLLIAVCTPFYLMGFFSGAVAHAGLHIDAAYSGGPIARTYERHGYQIVVHDPVSTHALQRVDPFVQIEFKPASALPAVVDEEIDLDGHGQHDVHVTFAMDRRPGAKLTGNVIALNGNYETMMDVGDDSFSRMIVAVNNEVIVRVPFHASVAKK
jgi:hypothetical protein